MSQTSTLDVEANTSADNARTDTLCENANVLAHQIENSSDTEKKIPVTEKVSSSEQLGESGR
ncbi:hypothetical protein NC652_002469 [Populus alba x Populus x berolinensis]|nr:hypothetical protein NC652_002469 [Populus alba x Populus x berolinensis]